MKKNTLMLPGIALSLSFLLLSCGGSGTDNDPDNTDSIKEEVVISIPEDAVFLTGLYATSTNTPFDSFAPAMLFDNADGYWATMPGAGPDEGVMLYFDAFDGIGSMELQFQEGASLGKILSIEVFVNGAKMGSLSPESAVFKDFKEPVNSVYLKISSAEGIVSTKNRIEEDEVDYTVSTFKSKLPLGISEIVFKDKEGKKINVMPPKVLKGKMTASSVLKPEEAYTPDFLFDSRIDFGWAEGNPDSPGTGEKLSFTFDKEITISKIRIWNGFHRSDAHYNKNARVKTFSFGSEGNKAEYNLTDEMKVAEITLKQPVPAKDFQFEILDVYPGSSYKDLVISEMQLYTPYGWTQLQTDGPEKRKAALMDKVKSSVLSQIVDRWYFESRTTAGNWNIITKSSIILRSNQSFVIWTDEHLDDVDYNAVQVVYDGNWELVSADQKEARIKIFGKRRMLSQGYGAYKGNKKSDQVTIFSDVLTITPALIRGEKFVDKIHLK